MSYEMTCEEYARLQAEKLFSRIYMAKRWRRGFEALVSQGLRGHELALAVIRLRETS
jgi:hypothetical protein